MHFDVALQGSEQGRQCAWVAYKRAVIAVTMKKVNPAETRGVFPSPTPPSIQRYFQQSGTDSCYASQPGLLGLLSGAAFAARFQLRRLCFLGLLRGLHRDTLRLQAEYHKPFVVSRCICVGPTMVHLA